MFDTPPRDLADDPLASVSAATQLSADATLIGSQGATARRAAEELETGTMVGRYVVLGKLGAGGMGVVYAAYDPELDRKVAVKLLRAGIGASFDARTRLLREAQALARLGHPNVVAVHDTGSVGERVWLAMEFVEGQTFAAWCAAQPERRSRWREVLAVMIRAGRGLQAAHEAGLIHRDFKPDNVMVSRDGRVRVMDLGLARRGADAVESAAQSTGRGILSLHLTQAGAVMGTPAYMAPEQFEGADVTPAADVFAFSVTLWEALYGVRPFAGETMMALLANLVAGRMQAPPRGRRVPAWLRRVLERGLASTPERRWPGMQAMLAALARGHTRARLQVLGASLLLLGGCAGAVWAHQRSEAARHVDTCVAAGASIDAVWGDAARERVRGALLATGRGYAATTFDKLLPWLDAQAQAWQRVRTAACLDTAASDDQRDRTLWCIEERHIALASLVERLAQADPQALQGAVPAAAGLERVESCLDRERLARLPVPPAQQRGEARALQAALARAANLALAGEYAAGLAAAQQARARAVTLGLAPLAAAARYWIGLLWNALDHHAAAERELEGAYFEALAAGADSVAADAAVQLITVVGNQLARHGDGRRWAQHAEAALRSLEPEPGLRSAARLFYLAIVEGAAGDNAASQRLDTQALAIRTRLLGPGHLDTAASMSNLGLTQVNVGEYGEGRALLARALPIQMAFLGPEHPEIGKHLANFSVALYRLGEYDEALVLGERGLQLRIQAHGADHTGVAASLTNLAAVYRAVDRNHHARALYERALAIFERRLGPSHPDVAMALINLAGVLEGAHEDRRALALFERALQIREAALPPDHPDIAWARLALASLKRDQGDLPAARALYARGIRGLEDALGPSHIELAYPLLELARLEDDAATPALCERALQLLAHNAGAPELLTEVRLVLAGALWRLPADAGRDRPRSIALLAQVQTALAGMPGQPLLRAEAASLQAAQRAP